MSSDDRFYQMEMRNRHAVWGDVGSLVKIEGLLIGGGGAHALVCLPGCLTKPDAIAAPTMEEWSDWLQRSDNPEILIGPVPNGQGATFPKIWHRKLRYEISGAVQQKVWAADGFKCVYCTRKMGTVLMTVDHFVPLEMGGKNDITNYVSACKPCNKDKGSEDPKTWCFRKSLSYQVVKDYLAERKV